MVCPKCANTTDFNRDGSFYWDAIEHEWVAGEPDHDCPIICGACGEEFNGE